jgi:hypothetical protein
MALLKDFLRDCQTWKAMIKGGCVMPIQVDIRRHGGWQRWMNALLACTMALLMGACAVPVHMQVDTGQHPKYQDKDVRFRTTYYFRVFDYCADLPDDPQGSRIQVPFKIDSLYRFRMTGKANSLTTRVIFESGTLTAGQIDPFGATVAYDEKNEQFYFKSQNQVQREAARSRQFKELDRLVNQYRDLSQALDSKAGENNSGVDQSLLQNFKTLIDRQLGLIGGQPGSKPTAQELQVLVEARAGHQTKGKELDEIINKKKKNFAESAGEDKEALANELKELEKELKLEKALINFYADLIRQLAKTPSQQITLLSQTPDSQNYCQNLARGFQILGPEGWRTFNQDDRLIMAMTTSGEPLIGTLNELSGRVLDNQPIPAELLLPLIKEELLITRTEAKLSEFSPFEADKLFEILDAAIGQFNPDKP